MKNLEQLKEELQFVERVAETEQTEFKGGLAKYYYDDKRRERPGTTRGVTYRIMY
jgi:hypothetical protein